MTDQLYRTERKILYKELEPLFLSLSSVKYAVVKGEVLSQQIYGVPDRRRSSDIDILIDKKNVKFLEEQLHRLGFAQKLPEDPGEVRRNRVLCMAYSHQIPSYHKDHFAFHLNVDVNYDIFWGEYEGRRCSIDEFLRDTADMEIYGVTVKTLPIEKAFVQLILHHYKEMNSLYHLSRHNCIRTGLFRDIYDILINHPHQLSADRIQTICDDYSIQDYGYYMLFYVRHIFPDKRLDGYVDALGEKANKELLDCFGLNSSERKCWNIPFSERLDCDDLKAVVFGLISEEDRQKIVSNQAIFT